nr:Os06g0143750 [Ipomoea batatas]
MRDGEAGDGDSGDDVGLEGLESVARGPLEYGDEVLHPQHQFPGERLVLELPEWVVGEEGFFHCGFHHLVERLRRRRLHFPTALLPLIIAISAHTVLVNQLSCVSRKMVNQCLERKGRPVKLCFLGFRFLKCGTLLRLDNLVVG